MKIDEIIVTLIAPILKLGLMIRILIRGRLADSTEDETYFD